ncbi:S66 peptidase family protein [Halalkalicoccus jeotgali]|uniref:LD-carboxypeptidase n=1 Tax=Halalkalicoccus jeotgali (strain DSM 18796 / CECT 7217 / JCM 14584 / KCTC 4019 / B3) TaxID=795797 RepID=D8J4E0_HALJB|nr:S66 peptidase family protein [Halalkalicoccus jeotgali]ADJ13502.1 LD-carboxypeptidase [Halalkalicoccus jeotgali B3]ELY33023.1 LD-carboxypeptidase [Halalkalicoccus jeotgali B3]
MDAAYPPPVERGDTVAVIAPSHAAPRGALSRGVERLRSLDLDVELFDTATRTTEWLRANPEARAQDVHRAFEREDVRGVIAAFGGNCQLQMLPHLDPETLRENPTRFFGASDNTHLHLFLDSLGLVSFYGAQLFPDLVADPRMHPATREWVKRALRETPFGVLSPAGEWTDEYYDIESDLPRTWFESEGWRWHAPAGRTVTAPVVGGCLAMLESQLLTDTPYFTRETCEGRILAVETSGETPTPALIERFFTALGERGILEACEALVVGKPETPGDDERERYRRRQRRTIAATVSEYADLPIVFDLDFGHPGPDLPLPMGAPMTVDAPTRAIRFAQSR